MDLIQLDASELKFWFKMIVFIEININIFLTVKTML